MRQRCGSAGVGSSSCIFCRYAAACQQSTKMAQNYGGQKRHHKFVTRNSSSETRDSLLSKFVTWNSLPKNSQFVIRRGRIRYSPICANLAQGRPRGARRAARRPVSSERSSGCALGRGDAPRPRVGLRLRSHDSNDFLGGLRADGVDGVRCDGGVDERPLCCRSA